MHCILKVVLGVILMGLAWSQSCVTAISKYDSPKYPADFTHFSYVNPSAPKKGELVRHALGGFDSFNAFSPQGMPAVGLSLLYDSLMVPSYDEPASRYGLLAQCVEIDSDKKWIRFTLNPEARFNDGTSVEAKDVVATFNLLLKEGRPHFKIYLDMIDEIQIVSPSQVEFRFSKPFEVDTLFLIVDVPIMSQSYWSQHDFKKGVLDKPLGSGPYTIGEFKPGNQITYNRVENYWAKNHPTRLGQFNFNQLKWVYFKDDTVAFEAFKSHVYDLRVEHRSKLWATGYQGPAFEGDQIIKKEVANREPQGMQGFVFNTRRPIFKDRMVRKAIGMAFDFNWVNRNLFYSQYQRATSYFNNSDLSAPIRVTPQQQKVYSKLNKQLPQGFLTDEIYFPDPENEAQMRAQLIEASSLLERAGWVVKDGIRVNQVTGERLIFEILITQASFERIILPYQANLKKLGIDVLIKKVTPSEYVYRLRNFDFDVTTYVFSGNLTPGKELYDYWSSRSAKIHGSQNISGVEDPIIDMLVAQVNEAKSRNELRNATQALDRYLMWQYLVVPQWYTDVYRLAYWNQFQMPPVTPPYELGIETWWSK